MDKEPLPPGVAPEQMALVGQCADHYSRHYEVVFTRVLPSGGTKDTLGMKPSPCRFCGRSRPEVKFSKVAHAVPEFVGNGVLLTNYECDECNERFSAFEDDLAKMTLLYLMAGQVRGKRGVPSVKTPQKLSRVDMEAHGIKFSHYEEDPIVVNDDAARTMTLTVKSQPYRPLGAYKSLVKMALTVMDQADLARVGALSEKDAPALRAEWRRLYRSHPPKLLRRDLLQLGVAWKLQERMLGGLSAATKRQLDELARTMATRSDLAKARKFTLRPGARLVRAWGGETHEVLVVDDGFLWQGKTWRSLSVIAREMTGTHWSGPRFFGLTDTGTKSDTEADAEGRDHE